MRVVLNGELLDGQDARLSALDEGLLYGYGLFETIRALDGHMPLLERHLDRLFSGAVRLGLPVRRERAAIARDLEALLAAEGFADARVRVTLTRGAALLGEGSTLLATAQPYALPAPPYDLCVVSGHPGGSFPLAGLKTIGYLPHLLARDRARAAGHHDALWLDAGGRVVEATTGNVFVVLPDGTVVTPPLSAGPLAGVGRAWAIARLRDEGATVQEAPLRAAHLSQAREVFLTNALMGAMPVRRLDGRMLPAIAPDGWGLRLREAFADLFRAR
ncbi:aminotransferase class IV family protein [bacterium]|nr:aminotransferase class IV family protein [bacterium]